MVSLPDDLHEPRHELERLDNLVLSALGEPVDPTFSEHLATCAECQHEMSALAQTADLARRSTDGEDVAAAGSQAVPPPSLWDGIAAELGLDESHIEPESSYDGSLRDPQVSMVTAISTGHGRRGWMLAVAAAVLAVVAGGIGYAAGNSGDDQQASVASSAMLAPMPGEPASASGSAQIRETSQGKQLTVNAVGLPDRHGYYEVWLFDPAINQMVAVGTLASDGSGTFPVPPGLDPSSYHVVDVSAQDYDGSPAHKQSVLRGQLSP